MKCISCKDREGIFEHYDKGPNSVCKNCVGSYFTCPDCGRLFEQDDRVNGDQGNGFCIDCAMDH